MWKVDGIDVAAVVEAQTDGIPPQFFFPDATNEDVAAESSWLVPQFAAADGTVSLRVQAFLVRPPDGRTILVDPCVGNGKPRELPFWNDLDLPWLDRLADAGVQPEDVDLVVFTHLHADHVGWATRLVDGAWVPTFVNARHLYVRSELEHWRAWEGMDRAAFADSVQPVLDAGLADVVDDPDHDLGGGLRLVSTPGHTPGHVSLVLGAGAVITGDLVHHPVQLARPEWYEIGDTDREQAVRTRTAFFAEHAARGTLVLGTHFPTAPAGHIVADGDNRWRFVAA